MIRLAESEADADDPRRDERQADPEQLRLDPRDVVRDADGLPPILGSVAVGEDEVIGPGTREVRGERAGRALRGIQARGGAVEAEALVLRRPEDEQVDKAAGRIREVPEYAARPEDLDRVDVGPGGPGRDRREG